MANLISTVRPTNVDIVSILDQVGAWLLPEQIRAAMPAQLRYGLGLQSVRNRLLKLYREGVVERKLLSNRKYVYHCKPPAPVTVDRRAALEHLCKTILPIRWNSATGTMAALMHTAVMTAQDRLMEREYLLSAECISFPIGMHDRKAIIRVTRTERKCRPLP